MSPDRTCWFCSGWADPFSPEPFRDGVAPTQVHWQPGFQPWLSMIARKARSLAQQSTHPPESLGLYTNSSTHPQLLPLWPNFSLHTTPQQRFQTSCSLVHPSLLVRKPCHFDNIQSSLPRDMATLLSGLRLKHKVFAGLETNRETSTMGHPARLPKPFT